jgi:hypothetical protein
MEKRVKELVDDLKRVHDGNLVSVVLYGSAVTGEHVEGRSNYNVLVVLEHITPSDLRLAQPVIDQWHREGNPLPLYFTREEMADASDVFPIEFIDMSNAHRVLYGIDPFDGLEISRRNLRHQLEYELRGKLIRLRELYIPASKDAGRLSALMVDSLSSFAVLFRHVLGLSGESVPTTKRAAIVQLTEKLRLDPAPFLNVLGIHDQGPVASLERATDYFAAYIAAIEAVIRRVDKLEDEELP